MGAGPPAGPAGGLHRLSLQSWGCPQRSSLPSLTRYCSLRHTHVRRRGCMTDTSRSPNAWPGGRCAISTLPRRGHHTAPLAGSRRCGHTACQSQRPGIVPVFAGPAQITGPRMPRQPEALRSVGGLGPGLLPTDEIPSACGTASPGRCPASRPPLSGCRPPIQERRGCERARRRRASAMTRHAGCAEARLRAALRPFSADARVPVFNTRQSPRRFSPAPT
jgi:hypothetical protein